MSSCYICGKLLEERTIEYWGHSSDGSPDATHIEEMLCPDEDCEGHVMQEPYEECGYDAIIDDTY